MAMQDLYPGLIFDIVHDTDCCALSIPHGGLGECFGNDEHESYSNAHC